MPLLDAWFSKCPLARCSNGESIARSAAITDLLWSVPVLEGEFGFGSSRSCLKRCSWASSCRLWSSSICIRASNLPLCCRKSFASARMLLSFGSMDPTKLPLSVAPAEPFVPIEFVPFVGSANLGSSKERPWSLPWVLCFNLSNSAWSVAFSSSSARITASSCSDCSASIAATICMGLLGITPSPLVSDWQYWAIRLCSSSLRIFKVTLANRFYVKFQIQEESRKQMKNLRIGSRVTSVSNFNIS